jgi:hypothetical protein
MRLVAVIGQEIVVVVVVVFFFFFFGICCDGIVCFLIGETCNGSSLACFLSFYSIAFWMLIWVLHLGLRIGLDLGEVTISWKPNEWLAVCA